MDKTRTRAASPAPNTLLTAANKPGTTTKLSNSLSTDRSEPRSPLKVIEVLAVVSLVVALYGGVLFVVPHFSTKPWPWPVERPSDAALVNVWDHPEPNFVVSAAVAEFWSVLTTFPIAGALLTYEAIRFKYGWDVLMVGLITCVMYTNACVAHCTLHTTLFPTTVLGVCNNALYSFGKFGFVVGGWMECGKCRRGVVGGAEVLVLAGLLTIPHAIGEGGGVWTLFVIQTPPVIYAWRLAAGLLSAATSDAQRSAYRVASRAGAFLALAMGVSLVECLVGFRYGFLREFWGLPWLHLIIHVSEQWGIYLYGVSVAALRLTVISSDRDGAAIRHLLCGLPYVYCPDFPAVADGNCGGFRQAASSRKHD